ncbi:MAG: 2-oxoacid:acceptor oxidoreductase subunit alpha [Candidatus Methylomirabilis oxygeniifera]|uniref:2-oxoglutarate ferredoxin oxidoreductase alpha subunit n=1 Tax=Methylomirabilis oxygeniifera TaxID=671143 RepID=D5MFZ8_METO1|nr:MAG: 2-oxoacid:acceptor oxidoreductase subunit alpha [Candidatus Methylomirabilis oxyfera]CBE68679.1 2-oxoglutarate ferredoxin oxidoreductase alpha subunit [Candidatus Methylomirabilis oxyfera]
MSDIENTQSTPVVRPQPMTELETVVIRFAGDSGDGMQLTGTEFTKSVALEGSNLATFPDYPSEIRAPAGTLAGVSAYQVHFSSQEVYTSGDQPDVLVVMNPAALRINLPDLPRGGIIIANVGSFTQSNFEKAGYKANPLEDGSLSGYQVFAIDISKQVALALEGMGLTAKEVGRCKNFYALGVMFWLYSHPMEREEKSIRAKFQKNPKIAEANIKAFRAGYYYGETAELFPSRYVVPPAVIAPGTYRHITGNEATAVGLITGAQLASLPLFCGTYPITPASDILHTLAMYPHYNVMTFQAEDEIAAITATIGAAYAGALGVTTTSGPGMALKTEAIGLAVMAELPLVVVNVQRGGPSTGLPTKTEQADLFQAVFGRNGECPVVVIAPATPSDCFWTAIEAARIAIRHMCTVIYLSDGYLANGAEPWKLPEVASLPKIPVTFRTDPEGFFPYLRDPETLARPWVVPGTPGMEHRIGGLEKEDVIGNVSYEAKNHEHMVRIRAEKIARIVHEIPEATVYGDPSGDLLIVGWGSTYGVTTQAVKSLRRRGYRVSALHLRYLNPMPANIGRVLANFRRVLVAEMNLGQLLTMLRAQFLVDAVGFHKVQGRPFKVSEIVVKAEELLGAREQAALCTHAEMV